MLYSVLIYNLTNSHYFVIKKFTNYIPITNKIELFMIFFYFLFHYLNWINVYVLTDII